MVSTRLALLVAGVPAEVLTSPPVVAEDFPYGRLEEAEVVVLRLHGLPNQPYLYGDNWLTALSLERVKHLVRGMHAIVLMEGCWGVQTGFPDVFLKKGARAVVASTGETVGKRLLPYGATRVTMRLLKELMRGVSIGDAMRGIWQSNMEADFVLVGNPDSTLRRTRWPS